MTKTQKNVLMFWQPVILKKFEYCWELGNLCKENARRWMGLMSAVGFDITSAEEIN